MTLKASIQNCRPTQPRASGSLPQKQHEVNLMYNNIADIDREIIALQEQRDYEIIYWFELGESDTCGTLRDRSYGLAPQYSESDWYMVGWHDREYQLAIGFTSERVTFDHF